MGMYTGLRFCAQLKEQAVPVIQLLNEAHQWDLVTVKYPYVELVAWSRVGRCNFIPFGAIAYMPDEWQQQSDEQGHSILVDGAWKVVCSLKNANDAIETFILQVLPILISQPCCCEIMYEEWEVSKLTMVTPRELALPSSRRCTNGLLGY